MNYQVYILKSLKNARHYTGITIDTDRRLREHNEGKTKSTRPHTPYKIIWTSKFMTKSDALKLEFKIKKKRAPNFLKENI